MAVLSLLFMSSTNANAQDLVLPQTGTDAVTLNLIGQPPIDALSAPGVLQVFVGTADDCCADKTPIAGRHIPEEDNISFTPAFGFDIGQTYVARVQVPGEIERLVPFRIPDERTAKKAAVTEIFPSGETLPENVLRFYIHFSVPMQPHVAFDFIQLRDELGNIDDAAFMRFKQELWNADRTRLTVLIDPGRIKREVATNRRLGPALRAGKSYTLLVAEGWQSADGTSVLPAFSKSFQVSDPLRTRPDATLWQLNAPCIGTADPLEITFDRPFDRHLLSGTLRVADDTGRQIQGITEVKDNERAWVFTPDHPWTGTHVHLAADRSLEDVAGNNFIDLLDHVSGDQTPAQGSTDLVIALSNCTG